MAAPTSASASRCPGSSAATERLTRTADNPQRASQDAPHDRQLTARRKGLAHRLQRVIDMDIFARYALFGCVLASSLGGIAVCVVGFKYGLAPPAEDDPIEATHRRLFVTHLAHAFAVVAFALTAMLAGSVLMLDRRAPSSAAGQRNEVQSFQRRLDGVEALVTQMTQTLERAIR